MENTAVAVCDIFVSHTVYTTLPHIGGLDKETVLGASVGEKEQQAELNPSTAAYEHAQARWIQVVRARRVTVRMECEVL